MRAEQSARSAHPGHVLLVCRSMSCAAPIAATSEISIAIFPWRGSSTARGVLGESSFIVITIVGRPTVSYLGMVATDSWASSSAVRRSMQSNRSRDTGPELKLRRALYALGLRYRVAARVPPGSTHRVDIVFGPSRVAVEVLGCFWHGCPLHHRSPASNSNYWAEKLERNKARDR